MGKFNRGNVRSRVQLFDLLLTDYRNEAADVVEVVVEAEEAEEEAEVVEEVEAIGALVLTIKRWRRTTSSSRSCTMSLVSFQSMNEKSFGTLFAKNYQTASDSQDQKGRLHILPHLWVSREF